MNSKLEFKEEDDGGDDEKSNNNEYSSNIWNGRLQSEKVYDVSLILFFYSHTRDVGETRRISKKRIC
jgi:hypothetical protein